MNRFNDASETLTQTPLGFDYSASAGGERLFCDTMFWRCQTSDVAGQMFISIASAVSMFDQIGFGRRRTTSVLLSTDIPFIGMLENRRCGSFVQYASV